LRLPDEEDETLVNRSLELLKHQALVDQDTGWTKAFALERLAAIRTHREMRNLFSLLEEALSLFQLHGDRWWQSEILNSLIYMSRIEGDFIQTRRYTGQLLEIRRELNDPLGSIRTTRTLAWLAQQDGRWEEAERLVRKVFALRLETGQIKQEVDAYMDLGWDLITVGGFKEARPALIRALEGWRNLGVIFREYLTKIHLAYALLFSGHYDEARDLAQEAADFYNRAEYIHLYCRSSNALACVALAQDRYEEAQQIFQETAQAYRKVEALLQESTSHALLSLAYSLLERPLLARKPLRKSLEGSVSSESYEVVGFILAAAALYALADGRIERAVSLYAAARQVPLVARSPWFDEVIGQRIEKRAGELPAQVVERARAQGGSADLWAVARELAEEFEALSGDSTSVP
jgi:tetratricopeptide (TPR) repeat protein